MNQFTKFELKCLSCESTDTTVSISMFDSCDIREVTCNNCKNEENW